MKSSKFRSDVFIKGSTSGIIKEMSLHGVIEMFNGEHYSFILMNNHYTRMTAIIKIDGTLVGRFMVAPLCSSEVDRPFDVTNKFKCVRFDWLPDEEKRVAAENKDFGLIEITVKFEKKLVIKNSKLNAMNVLTSENDSVDETTASDRKAQVPCKIQYDSIKVEPDSPYTDTVLSSTRSDRKAQVPCKIQYDSIKVETDSSYTGTVLSSTHSNTRFIAVNEPIYDDYSEKYQFILSARGKPKKLADKILDEILERENKSNETNEENMNNRVLCRLTDSDSIASDD
ncbi:hypothetical protein CsNV_060 [Callinectes sapidus nudivirus]|nr:hypothetical protein CsNV_060 [Callinectes sapidus nudivirus]